MSAELGPVDELAAVFTRVSGLLLTEQTVGIAVQTVTSLAVDTIAGSAGAGISLFNTQGAPTTSAATDTLVEQLDTLQYELDDGPCLNAWRDRAVVSSGSLDTEERWPGWSRRANELGVRSVLSAPLIDHGRALGAMKVYSTEGDAYGEREQDLLRRFATQAAIFVSNVVAAHVAGKVSDALRDTLHTRDLIATARGIVMVRRGMGVEEANRYLMSESYRSREVIRDVAERIVTAPEEV